MTKLVTAYTALRLWEERGWDLNRRFSVPPAADFRAAPPHSSLMFLQTGQTVSLKELLCGLMIPSGNDAAVAVNRRGHRYARVSAGERGRKVRAPVRRGPGKAPA